VDGATYTPSATGGASDNPVVFTIAAKSAAVCTIDAGVVSFVGPGSCIIEADQAGSPTFEVGHASQKFAVLIGQKITFTSKPPKTPRVKGRIYTPTALGGASGNPVVFKIPKRAAKICRLRKGVVSFIGVGRCAVRANQAGDATYAAATRVTQAFAVHKAK
jgi:hypothetical protein